ncbi:zinc finger protein 543 isoform X2 [Anabrus simplex]|uniref:zinc finger protein 543 isoform X2 n=1 Tax=Anabrus simplex TaxID=316456 RepID=UPI0035A26C8A
MVKKLSEMTADTDREQNSAPKNIRCLICNSRLGVSSRNSCEIFHKNVCTSTTERPISFIIGAVLEHEISEDTVHSNVICKKCFKLLDEVDEIESRLAEIKVELTTSYKRTIKIQTEGEKEEEDDDRKLPLSSDDPNIVKQKMLARSRKKPTPKKIKSSQSTGNSEEEYEQKENTLCEVEMSDHDSEYHPDIIHTNDVDGDGNDKEVVKIKIEPEDEPGDLNKDMMKRKMIKKKPKTIIELPESEIPEKVICREGTDFSCLLCTGDEKIMGDMKGIINHMKNVHNVKVYICDICGQDFRKRNELSVHLDEHVAAEEGDFQCEVCNRIFSNLRLFRVHKRMHYPQSKLWTCETCGKRYSSRNLLDEHINTHTGVRPYICEVCGKDFASKYTYKAHTKTHEVRPRPFSCQECGKTFLSAQNLAQHERTHTGMRNYVCDQCGKAFGTARNLEVHSVVHSGYKPFICRTCGKAFARKAEIRDHERTHTGEKPYQCEFCGATFSQRSNLQSHKRATHYQDKRYKCTECGKGFKRRRLLDYHVKAAHTGERPYKCPTCDATFVYPEHFKKHRRIHTGEKPFHCEVCGKAFNSRDNRNAHRFVHSDKKPYECLVCGTGFMRKPLLYNHMQTQGHLNDTIVVNQPRLTSEEDLLHEAEELGQDGGEVEMTIVDGLGQHQDQEAKLYIAELKEHVIIQQDGDNRCYAEKTVVLGDADTKDEVDQHMVQETVEHLIIDGSVHFTDPNELASIHGDIGSVAEITTSNTSSFVPHRVGEGRHTLVVPATPRIMTASGQNFDDPHQAVVEDSSAITTLTTTHGLQGGTTHAGPVQLIQIRIPSEPGNSSRAWVNLVENAQ